MVDGLAGAAVPNYQVEDALQRTAEVSEVIKQKLNMEVFEFLMDFLMESQGNMEIQQTMISFSTF